MKSNVIEFIKTYKLFTSKQKLLVAVSGGVDSMVLLHILSSISKNVSVAHCNFNLRADDSMGDQLLVENFCKKNTIPCFVKQFNVGDYKKKNKVSTQVAARDLRYQWFNQLRETEGFDLIAVAHNANDQVETFLLNSCRGTGITGLGAMLPKNEFLIRPLLKVNKADIYRYASENSIPFREDSSNASNVYARNRIRNNVIPSLCKINPAVIENISNTIEQIHAIDTILNKQIQVFLTKNIRYQGDKILIDNSLFASSPEGKFLLFEFLAQYAFNRKQVEDVFSALQSSQNGQVFESESFELYCAKTEIILQKRKQPSDQDTTSYAISTNQCIVKKPIYLELQIIINENYQIVISSQLAQLDADLVKFPLILRKWKMGDTFSPLGIKTKQKLSDYFINKKFTKDEKKASWLLCNNDGEIIWLVGHQINEHFKITSNTKSILKITSDGTY